MSCCGDQRASFRREAVVSASSHVQHWNPGVTEFEYAGSGQLTVTGPLTGTVYRFISGAGPVRVHAPDAASLVSVPGLRPIQ